MNEEVQEDGEKMCSVRDRRSGGVEIIICLCDTCIGTVTRELTEQYRFQGLEAKRVEQINSVTTAARDQPSSLGLELQYR